MPQDNFADRPRQEEVERALDTALGHMSFAPGRQVGGGEEAFNSIENNYKLTPQEKLFAHQEMMTRLETLNRPGLITYTEHIESGENYMKAAAAHYGQEATQEMQNRVKASLAQQVTASTGQPIGTGRSMRVTDESTAEGRIDKAVSTALASIEKPPLGFISASDSPHTQGQRFFRDIEQRKDLTAAEKQVAYQEITAQIMRNGRVGNEEHYIREMEREQGFLQAFTAQHGAKALAAIESAKRATAKEQSLQQSQKQSQPLPEGPKLQQEQGVSQPQEISQDDNQKESVQQTQEETPSVGDDTEIQAEQGVSPPQEISQDDHLKESVQQGTKEKPSLNDETGVRAKQEVSDPGKLSQDEGQQQKQSVRDSLGSKAWGNASGPKNDQQRSVRDAIGAHRGEPKPGVKTQVKIGGHR